VTWAAVSGTGDALAVGVTVGAGVALALTVVLVEPVPHAARTQASAAKQALAITHPRTVPFRQYGIATPPEMCFPPRLCEAVGAESDYDFRGRRTAVLSQPERRRL
jgi:hypothetical protein